MNIIPHPWPEARAAHDAGEHIQCKWPSSDWIDFDPDSSEPPSFHCPILQWRKKPAVLHPMIADVLAQFNSQFGVMK